MAIYHLSTKPLSRSAGRSAVAASAYRAGVELRDERTALVHDYERRSGVEWSAVITPAGEVPAAERAALWNAAEAAEKRKDARTAREWVLAVPVELVPRSPEAARLIGDPASALVREFATELAKRHGVAVDVAMHRPGRKGDERNWHAHLLATTRQVTRDESGRLVLDDKAAIELSDAKRKAQGLGRAADEVKAVRELWADLANRALAREGHRQRIDHRNLEAQGLERPPTVHLGPAATEIERRGERSDRGDHNRHVAEVIDLTAVRTRLEKERQEEVRRAEERERQRRAAPAALEQEKKQRQEERDRRIDELNRRAATLNRYAEQWERLQMEASGAVSSRADALKHKLWSMAQELTQEKLEPIDAKRPKPPGALSRAFGGEARYERRRAAWHEQRDPVAGRIADLNRRAQRVRPFAEGYAPAREHAHRRLVKTQPGLFQRQLEHSQTRSQAISLSWGREKEQRQERELQRGRGRGGPDRGGGFDMDI